jgi:dTDP-4-amino-4,6-dideoxygalactose transaminase
MSVKKEDITFNRPTMMGRELDHVRLAVERMHISGDGDYTRRCTALLRSELGVAGALLTTSCTAALEMTALLLDADPGDEVIVPSFAFVSAISGFALRGLKPVFVDIRRDTLNLDETLLAERITDRTRAIVLVHYSGVGCEMGTIGKIAAERGIEVIEDNAHGLFARYQGKPLGTFGRWSTLSFHETKNLTCGEGGALLLNRAEDLQRAEILRDKGTNRAQLLRGEVDKYTWVDHGSSYALSDLLAAYLWAQFEERERIRKSREQTWNAYDGAFRGVLERRGVQLPVVPAGCEPSHHIYWMLLPDLETRTRFIECMKADGILCVSHYQPLHASVMGRKLAARELECPVSTEVSERLVRLPFYNDLSAADRERVIEAVGGFFS